MVVNIERNEVRRLVENDAQLVDVLPSDEFEIDHLPGAINLPLEELERERADRLARDRPVVLYCQDAQ